MNENGDTKPKIYAAKAMPTGKYVAVNVYMNKERLEVGSCNTQCQQNKSKAHTISSVEAEDEIRYPFSFKNNRQNHAADTQRNFFNLRKGIGEKSTINIILNGSEK